LRFDGSGWSPVSGTGMKPSYLVEEV
jgi:hypothetical protein